MLKEHLMERVKLSLKDWGALVGIGITLIAVVVGQVRQHIDFVASQERQAQLVLRHDQVLSAWERQGTPAVVQMKATYDEHFRASDSRLDKLEIAAAAVARIESRLDVIAALQINLKETQTELKASLEDHKRLTMDYMKK